MKNIIFLTLIFLFYSCESDPIQTPVHQGVQYKQYIFKIDDMIETYQDSSQFINTALGSLLTSGVITDSLVNTTPYDYEVKSIVSLDLSKFFDYEYSICHSTEENEKIISIEPLTISLFSTTSLSDVVASNDLSIKLLPFSIDSSIDIDEDVGAWDSYGEHSLTDDITCSECESLVYNVSVDNDKELIITLPVEGLLNQDLTAVLCQGSHINLVLEYMPAEDNETKYIEWYSSDFSITPSLTPKFNVDYIKMELVDTVEYQFSLEDISSSNNKYYYINDELSSGWSTVYFVNIQDSISGAIDSLIDFRAVTASEPLDLTISEDINSLIKNELGTLRIKVNDKAPDSSIAKIQLALNNAIAYYDTLDPSGDNYNDSTNVTGTENNGKHDILYNSAGTSVIAIEEFNDFGVDQCENQYEDGNQGCCDDNLECLYNILGTENNNLINWIDEDGDGLWSIGDIGESWEDIGLDGCSDEYETGNPLDPCSDQENSSNSADPNGDNYNPDPKGDDYSADNLEGTEGNGELDWIDQNENGVWDDGEGEQWLDYGLDGIPYTNDEEEDDLNFNPNFENFFDYGEDNTPNQHEDNYCGNISLCTEKNTQYDGVPELNDVGEDGCPDEHETGTLDDPQCLNLEDEDAVENHSYTEGEDPHGDNYNSDPNSDDYNSQTESGSEGDNRFSWYDCNDANPAICENSIDWTNLSTLDQQQWDNDSLEVADLQEEWFDYGLDNTQDAYEKYLPENSPLVSMGSNTYEIDINNFSPFIDEECPQVGSNGIAIWISSIQYISEEQVYELTISTCTTKELIGLEFSLRNPDASKNLRVSWSEEYERHKVQSVSLHAIDEDADGNDDNTEKMFEDFSLYPLHSKSSYTQVLSDSLALLNYGHDIFCKLESNDFISFVNDSLLSTNISHLSKIVIPIDTISTKFNGFSYTVDLGLISETSQEQYPFYHYGLATQIKPVLEIGIADVIQYHIQKDILFEGFNFKNNSSENFNSLYLKNNGGYIYMVIEQ